PRTKCGMLALLLVTIPLMAIAHAEQPSQPTAQASPATGEPAPGTIINSDNASSYSRYIPAALMFAVEHGFKIRVVPTQRIEWPENYKKQTEHYSPQVGLDSNDYIQNYTAGLPFPLSDISDPKAAVKIAYNWRFNPFIEDDSVFKPAEWKALQTSEGKTSVEEKV